MPYFLKPLETRLGDRFALYRRMCDHIGISREGDAPDDAFEHRRAALLACASCGDADICSGWLDQCHAGLPLFCRAREAFQRLAAVENARREPDASGEDAGIRLIRQARAAARRRRS